MFIIIRSILSGMFWPLFAVLVYCMVMRARSVKGTRQRYVAKTGEIACLILIPVDFIVGNFIDMLFIHTDIGSRGFYTVLSAIIVVFYGRMLLRLLRDDDDDWFNDQWKKLKRGFKKLRARLQPKPAFSPAPA